MNDSVHIAPGGTLVYILVEDRSRFENIPLDVTDHGDKGDEGHVLSKHQSGSVYIVFQHWVKSPALRLHPREIASQEAAP